MKRKAKDGSAKKSGKQAGAVALAALVAVLVVGASHLPWLVAQARARQLLDDFGEGAPPRGRGAFGRGLWAFVLLVFVLMAVLALSKRWF